MFSRFTVEVNKLPATRREVPVLQGDTVIRALIEAFGEADYGTYTITVNGQLADLNRVLSANDSIAIAKQTKGN